MVWDKEKMGQDKTKHEQSKKNEISPEKKTMITEDTALGEIASDKIFEKDPELAKELAEDRKILERAQEYKEKKTKQAQRRKKNILVVFLIIALSAAGGTAYYMQQKKASQVSLTDITITSSQELVYAKITQIVGNEISASVVTKDAENEEASAGNDQSSISGSGDSTAHGQNGARQDEAAKGESTSSMQESATAGGSMPSIQGSAQNGGSMPSMQGGAPTGGSMPSMQNGAPTGGSMPSMQGGAPNASGVGTSVTSYTETGEDVSYEIPVGTVVVTKLGTEATFSSLSAGDVIAVAVEKNTEVIDRIWIVQ